MCTWEYNISKPWKGTKLNWREGMEGKPTWKWKCFQFGSKPKRSGDLEIWMDLGIWVGAELLIPSEHCGPSDPARWKAQRTRWAAGVAPSNECCFAASKRRDCARAGSGQIKLDLGPPIRFDYISAWRSPTRRQTSISSKSIALLLSSHLLCNGGEIRRTHEEARGGDVFRRPEARARRQRLHPLVSPFPFSLISPFHLHFQYNPNMGVSWVWFAARLAARASPWSSSTCTTAASTTRSASA